MSRTFTRKSLYISLFLIPAFFSGCLTEPVLQKAQLGDIRAFRYVALGDGYTAGMSNSLPESRSPVGLYEEAQEVSFAHLLANQLSMAVPVDFVTHPATGSGSGFRKVVKLMPPLCDFLAPEPLFAHFEATAGWGHPPESGVFVNNRGVPHLRVSQLLNPSSLTGNIFFKRLNSGGCTDYVCLSSEGKPDFFTLWLGVHDVLDYAMSGATRTEFAPTPVEDFGRAYAYLLDSLFAAGDPSLKGVVGNIPDITYFPYFEAINPQFVAIENCLAARQDVYIKTHDGTTRVATLLDRLLLPAKDAIGTANGMPGSLGLHPQNPLPDQWVLDKEEVLEIQEIISGYNAAIDSVVGLKNAGFLFPAIAQVDLYHEFSALDRGLTVDGLRLSGEYMEGGVFSTEGIYLTPRGNAWLANLWIDAINEFVSYRAHLSPINLSDYPGVVFP
ncbi:MAG: hypothetical protein EAZ89_16605 [Bacteroidetes bacterium]|nr:MAG: hypothetical protein EAZ89_16605 [Bacteroidota bacterium]